MAAAGTQHDCQFKALTRSTRQWIQPTRWRNRPDNESLSHPVGEFGVNFVLYTFIEGFKRLVDIVRTQVLLQIDALLPAVDLDGNIEGGICNSGNIQETETERLLLGLFQQIRQPD